MHSFHYFHLLLCLGVELVHLQVTFYKWIRSYVFQPYTLVKDNRTGVEKGNIQGVMRSEEHTSELQSPS